MELRRDFLKYSSARPSSASPLGCKDQALRFCREPLLLVISAERKEAIGKDPREVFLSASRMSQEEIQIYPFKAFLTLNLL